MRNAATMLLQGCAQATSPQELAQRVLPALAEHVKADLAGCATIDENEWRVGFAPSDMPELISDYSEKYMAADPIHIVKRNVSGCMVALNHLLEPRAFHATDVYQKLLRPWKLEHVVIVRLSSPTPERCGFELALYRKARSGDFDSADRRMLTRFLPAFTATAERVTATGAANEKLDLLAALAEANGAICVLEADGRLAWHSRQASHAFHEAIVALRGQNPIGEAARVLARGTASDPAILQHRFTCADGEVTADLSLLATDGAPKILVRLRAADNEDALLRWCEKQSLSKREATVFQELARGHSNANIAQHLFISQATVRTHVDRILQKLQVESRLQAVVRAQKELARAR